MSERLSNSPVEQPSLSGHYRNSLIKTEGYCKSIGADHRFVGGTIADLLSPDTHISIDPERRIVAFRQYPPLTAIRTDGSVKDVDVIFFTECFEDFQTARQDFASWQKTARLNGEPFPALSAEAARYPHWPSRSRLKQFVTAWEIDPDNTPSLNFGSIHQPIHPRSIEPWTYQLEEDQIAFTGLNPLGFALCYVLRVPSGVKMKDKKVVGYEKENDNNNFPAKGRYSKMSLVMGLGGKAHREGLQYGIDLKSFHKEWIDYIHKLHHTNDSLIRFKAAITTLYWKHLGTDAAHGKGLLGIFSRFNDKMSG